MSSSLVAPPVVAPPRYLTHPLPIDRNGAGLEAVELAASAGLRLDEWQEECLHIGLAERPDGKWAARRVGEIVARQNGKGSILEALELAGLYLFELNLIIHSAHEFATSSEAFRRLLALIEGTPDLDRRVKAVHRSHGSEGIELLDGRRILFKTRTGGGGRGFSGDLVILDEAYNLQDKAVSALGPTMSAMPNPQIWFTSSAPTAKDESAVLRRWCKEGREGAPGLAYMEFCAEDSADLDDPAAIAQANPGYPHRINDDAIATERQMMTDDDFARERLGIWVDPADLSSQVIPSADWATCHNADSGITGPQVFAIDVAEDRSVASFAAAGRSTVGDFVHVEVVAIDKGTAWVAGRAADLKAKHGGRFAIAKGSPAASLIKDLKAAGLTCSSPAEDTDDVVLVSPEDQVRMCGQLYDAAVNHTLRHRAQPDLDVAVRGAVKRDAGDAWMWSRRRSGVDIAPLAAITWAAGVFGTLPTAEDWDFFIV